MTIKPPKLWVKHYKRGTWKRSSEPTGWYAVSNSTLYGAKVYETRKWDTPPKLNFGSKPSATPSRAAFYSRKYYFLENLPFGRYDPWKYKDRPPPSSEAPKEIIQTDELLVDDQPTYTWSSDYKSFAEQYLPGAITSLTTMQRQVYLKRHEEGMTMTDIARELDICRSAVHRRYQRARERIKEYLKKIPKK